MSLFVEALKSLFDETDLFDRKEWASLLRVASETVEEWLSEKTIPRPSCLRLILTVIEESSDIPPEPLEKFKAMAMMPAREVSPWGKLMLPTVWEYSHRPMFCDLSNKLARLSLPEREKFLDEMFPE